jgi:hypothetical protein
MTPRVIDVKGLSFQLTKPSSGPYVQTTVDAVNASLILHAEVDGPDHASVTPSDGEIAYWTTQRQPNTGNPTADSKIYNMVGQYNIYTTMLLIIGSYDKWVTPVN